MKMKIRALLTDCSHMYEFQKNMNLFKKNIFGAMNSAIGHPSLRRYFSVLYLRNKRPVHISTSKYW